MSDERYDHRWSGWPGAWCMDCGCSDPMELAVGCRDCFTHCYPGAEQEGPERFCDEHAPLIGQPCPAPKSAMSPTYEKRRLNDA